MQLLISTCDLSKMNIWRNYTATCNTTLQCVSVAVSVAWL